MEQFKEGIVLVMDALGSKGLWKYINPIEYIKSLKDFETGINEKVKPIFDNLASSQELKSIMIEKSEFEMISFSDTIIITYIFPKFKLELPESRLFGLLFSSFQAFTEELMVNALNRRIFYRGSISYGQIYKDGTHILGPAIDDAAYYSDKANWIGLFCTPSTTLAIQGLSYSDSQKPSFVSYPVPFKDGKAYELCCTNWPKMYKSIWDADNKDSLTQLKKLFSSNIIPDDAIIKYFNTIDFFKKAIS